MTQEPQQLDIQTFLDKVREIFIETGKALQPMIDGFVETCQDIHDAMHDAYLNDGAIYGNTHEGLMRWMEERSKVNRLRTEADMLEQHQIGLRVFRQRMIERRGQEHAND
jgi:methionyl-tRNA synthetase